VKDSSNCYSLDANVILRFLMRDEPQLAEQAKLIIQAIRDGRIVAYLDPVILDEAVFTMKSFYHVPLDSIASRLLAILALDGIIVPDKDRYIDALTLLASGVHFGDACACAMARRQCGGRLLSFDRKLSRVPGVERLETV
jgi:predicted nucleic acid-binding protein